MSHPLVVLLQTAAMSLRFVLNRDLLEDPGPLEKYRLPYYLGIYRIILAFCQCYAVSWMEADRDILPFFPQIQALLMMWAVGEMSVMMKWLTGTVVPKNEEQHKKQIWKVGRLLMIRLLVIISVCIVFWQLEVKSLGEFVGVSFSVCYVDGILATVKCLFHDDQLTERKKVMQAGRIRETRDFLPLLPANDEEQNLRRLIILLRIAVSVYHVCFLIYLLDYRTDVPYDLYFRLLWSTVFVCQSIHFALRLYLANPKNVSEVKRHHAEMYGSHMNGLAILPVAPLYLALTDNSFIGTLQLLSCCQQVDLAILRMHFSRFREQFGMERNEL